MSFGIISLEILRGQQANPNAKENYYVHASPPTDCTKVSGQIRTGKMPGSGLDWNFATDIVLTNSFHGSSFTFAFFQHNTIMSDKKLGSCVVDIEPLASGGSIESQDFPCMSDAGEEACKVTLCIRWKDGQTPDWAASMGGATATANPMDPSTGGVNQATVSGASGASVVRGGRGVALPIATGGDYGVRCRLHKATNLQSLKEDSLYNPQVVVTVLDKSQKTETCKKTNCPIWDEETTFAFNKVKDTFWTETIEIKVISNNFGFNDTIGSVTMDLGTIYRSSPLHYMNKKWMILRKSQTEGNVMGFVKVSILVLNLRTDAVPEVDDEEQEEESEETIINNLVSGPGAVFEEVNLHCDVVKAEGLPVMDGGPGGTADPYVRFIFGKKTVNTSNIRNTLNPVWNTSVCLPVMLPSLTNTITVQLWDYDAGSPDDIIATRFLKLDDDHSSDKDRETELYLSVNADGLPFFPSQWINFYGHPRANDADYNRYFKAMAKGEKKGLDYRGRMLMRMFAYRGKDKPVPMPVTEVVMEVVVTAQLLQYSMIPDSGKYKVRVSMGTFSACTQVKETMKMNGTKNLYSIYFGEEVTFTARFPVVPKDKDSDQDVARQLPEVIFQLVTDSALKGLASAFSISSNKEEEPYASTRFPARKMISKGKVFCKCKSLRMCSDPEKAREGSAPANPMGQIVCGLFTRDCQPPHPSVATTSGLKAWSAYVNDQPMEKYILDCFVFQVRQCPAGDSNGLSDPFIRVTWANGSARTGVHKETLNPIYNERLRIVADTKQLFPDICIELWDWDLIGRDTFLCKDVIEFNEEKMIGHQIMWCSHFTDTYGNRAEGCQVLLSFNVRKATPQVLQEQLPTEPMLQKIGSKDYYDGVPIPMQFRLPMARYSINFSLFGLRQMRKFRLRELQKPSVEVGLGSYYLSMGKQVGHNPDFNVTMQLIVDLSKDKAYFPQMMVRVYDTRIGIKTLVCAAIISCDDDQFDPQQQLEIIKKDDARIQDNLSKMLEAKQKFIDSDIESNKKEAVTIVPGKKARMSMVGKLGSGLAGLGKSLSFTNKPETSVTAERSEALDEPLLKDATTTSTTINSQQELGSKVPTPEDTAMVPIEPKVDVKAINAQIAESLAIDERPGSPTVSEVSTEPEEDLWFDRFDPEGMGANIEPANMVARLGKLGVLPAGHSTCEDMFGPFDEGRQEIELGRGWGKDKSKAGVACLQMSIVPADQNAPVTVNPVPKKIEGRTEVVPFLCRIYVVNCRGLSAMDDSPLGKSSDPYLIFSLKGGGGSRGEVKLNCKDDGKFQTLDPDFFLMKEMDGRFPEHCYLTVTVVDYDKIGFDEEIGSTEISLEDRWYSNRGYQHHMDNHLKPGTYTETRVLRNKAGLTQGTIEMWVDVFQKGSDAIPRPIDVAPPPPIELEMRCVIWNARDVLLVDTNIHGEEMTDIYIRCWMEGMIHDVQNTDVHYRSLDGSGNFNWRMNFPLVFEPRQKKVFPVGSKSRVASFFKVRKEQKKYSPLLHVQIFDNDLLPGSDDFIGEQNLDLLRCYPCTTRRTKTTLFGMMTSEVTKCCNIWPFNKCCKKSERHELSLDERRELAMKEQAEERAAQQASWNADAEEKLIVLRATGKYNADQLERMRKAFIKEAKKASQVNVFESFVPQRRKKSEANNPKAKPVTKETPKVIETAKYWFPCRGPFGGGRVGDVQISFQLVTKEALKQDEKLSAGKGRSDPQGLPEPNRPDSSFFWLSSPWKAAVHILWKNYKWWFFTIVCIIISALFIYVFFTTGIETKAKRFFDDTL